jgi:RNA polymerase primary sigma factor
MQGEDDDSLISALYREISTYPQMKQNELVEQFELIEDDIDSVIDSLFRRSVYVERSIAELVREVAASNTHGRCIYKRSKLAIEEASAEEEQEDKKTLSATDVDPRDLYNAKDIKFLESSITLLKSMAFYQHPKKLVALRAKAKARRCIKSLNLLRAVFEQVLDGFCVAGKPLAKLVSTTAVSVMAKDVQAEPGQLLALVKETSAAQRRLNKVRDKVFGAYLRLVFRLAHGLSNNYSQLLDNFQNGASGLLRAISYYDHDSGSRFASYATWWIRQAILLHLKLEANLIRLPIGVWQNYAYVERTRKKVQSETGEAPVGAAELAEATGLSEQQLNNLYESVSANQHIYSLDMPITMDSRDTGDGRRSSPVSLLNVLEDELAVSPDAQSEQQTRESTVKSLLQHLNPHESLLLCLHYGLFDHLPANGVITPEDRLRERLRQLAATPTI